MIRSEDLTAITVTHFSPRSNYGSIAPPSSDLVRKTVESLRNKVIDQDIRHLLIYNKPTDQNEKADKYKENLELLSDDIHLEMHTFPNRGLRRALVKALEMIDTPYITFIEHDWEFLTPIPIEEIIDVFKEHSTVNYIRFNKRKNISKSLDTKVIEDQSKPVPLCKVSTFSNNPYIARSNVIQEWVENSKPGLGHWIRMIQPSSGVQYRGPRKILSEFKAKMIDGDPHVGSFDGVERVIDTRYKQKINKIGFEEAHKKTGTYLYGPKDAGPYVRHLGRDTS